MAETISYKSKARNLGLLFTLLVVGTILTILLLIIIRTPIPPYPEGGGGAGNGIELNLGFSDAGMGSTPEELSAPEKESSIPEAQTKPANEKILTQDIEDAPSINEKVADKKVKKEVRKDNVVVPKKEVKKEAEKPKVNPNALYPAKGNKTSADGNSKVAGDQGDPNGNLAQKAFGGNGGKGGTGGGTGGGNGKGTGNGNGDGATFDLKNRRALSLPNPEYKSQSEGVVVVNVTVDKEGNVTQAEPGQKGTTISDNTLWDAARNAAEKAHFDRKPDAPAFQKGTITYRFRLQ